MNSFLIGALVFGSALVFSQNIPVPMNYKKVICRDIKGGVNGSDSYDVKDCMKGSFSTTGVHFAGKVKTISYLGTNQRGFKFSCQLSINSEMKVVEPTTCIDLFLKKWPRQK